MTPAQVGEASRLLWHNHPPADDLEFRRAVSDFLDAAARQAALDIVPPWVWAHADAIARQFFGGET